MTISSYSVQNLNSLFKEAAVIGSLEHGGTLRPTRQLNVEFLMRAEACFTFNSGLARSFVQLGQNSSYLIN